MVNADVIPETNGSSMLSNGSVTDQTKVVDKGCEGQLDIVNSVRSSFRGEFSWDKGTRSRLLAMYFYGYILTQVPGGWLAARYGGKLVWGICMFVCAVCTLATPISARTNVYLMYALRFVLGFAAGVTFPCTQALFGRWSPPLERTILAAVAYIGPAQGTLITFSISGYMCEYGFDNGWGSIFYLSGISTMIWVLSWFCLTADRPEHHKRISPLELNYIQQSIGRGDVQKVRKVPWGEMLRSRPVWANIIVHAGSNYTNYTLITLLPTFMKESLKFDIKQNGLLSSLPYLMQIFASLFAGVTSDMIRQKGWLTTKSVRKIFQGSSVFGMAICSLSVGQLDCSQRYIAVFVLCLCTICLGLGRAGYAVNQLDLAPSFAGILYGFSNTAATIPGMIAPIIAGALTPNKTAEEWHNVFYVCAGVSIAAGIVYVLLAEGELQLWADRDFFQESNLDVPYKATAQHSEDSFTEGFIHDEAQNENLDGPVVTNKHAISEQESPLSVMAYRS